MADRGLAFLNLELALTWETGHSHWRLLDWQADRQGQFPIQIGL